MPRCEGFPAGEATEIRNFGLRAALFRRQFSFFEEFFAAFALLRRGRLDLLVFESRKGSVVGLGGLRCQIGAMGAFFRLRRVRNWALAFALQSIRSVSRAVQVEKTEKVPKNYPLVWPRAVDGL